MKIKDCQTLPEFFGVEFGGCVWVEGHKFEVRSLGFASDDLSYQDDARALVGCLTGQLEWSRHEPMTTEEEDLLRELAAWFPKWEVINRESIALSWHFVFGDRSCGSKAYAVLAPILEKHGEINLDEYKEQVNEKD